MRQAVVLVLAALGLAACEGDGATEQVVTVLSDPPGASCNISRENMDLGTVPATPGSLRVSKGVAPLIVACSAAGYETITGGFEALYRGNAPAASLTSPFSTPGGAPPNVDPRYYSYPDQLKITLRR